MKNAALILLVLLLMVTSVFFYGCGSSKESGALMDMTVKILKIGKADSFVIETGNHTVLIDAGEEEDAVEILAYLEERGIEKIDTMVITHFDSANIGGADVIINSIRVDEVVEANYRKKTSDFLQYLQAMDDNNIFPKALNFNHKFTYDATEFTVMPALKATYIADKDNECSLAITVKHGENTFLFAGDALTERMDEIVRADIGEVDFLKVPNHGIYSDGFEFFVNYLKPKYAVITCSDKNPPDEATVSMLESVGASVYETRDGNVTISSNGTDEIKIRIG